VVALSTTGNIQTFLAVLAGLTAPGFVTNTLELQLFLFGADYRQQALHNIKAVLLFAALPALLSAIVTGFALGWNVERASAVGLLAAVFGLRLGWRGLVRVGELIYPRAYVRLPLVGMLALSFFVSNPPATWVGIAASVLGIAGMLGIVLRLRGLRESVLAAEMRDLSEQTRGY
jgi:hypothetical protein